MKKKTKIIWLVISLVVFAIIAFIPTPAALTGAGQIALAVTAMALVLWITEAVPYTVSATMIVGLLAVFMGLQPSLEDPTVTIGTKDALRQALSGFATPSLALVAGGLFIAVAMEATGLHKRIAFIVLDKIGTKPRSLVLGVIIVSIILALFVPSATARSGALVPIVLGIVTALKADKKSNLMKMLLVTTVTSISIWNYGIKTAAAQNLLSLQFINDAFNVDISWIQWLIYGGPLAILMSIALFIIAPRVFKVSEEEYVSDPNAIKKELHELGPVTANEKKLMVYSLALLVLWSTEQLIHPIDSTTVTLFVFMLMLLPVIGVMGWKEVEKGTSWGTLITFGIGISLGTILLNSGAASWVSENTLGAIGVQHLHPVMMTIVLSIASILIHLGFASATSLASVFMPIVIGLILLNPDPNFNPVGIALLQAFVISFGYILPVNAPQNMLAFGTGGYTAKDLMKVGIPITIVGVALIAILALTYWQWVGLI